MNKVITFPTRLNIKGAYRHLVGKDKASYLLKALQSDRARVRYAAARTVMADTSIMLAYFNGLTDHNKDLYCSGLIVILTNKEGK